MPRPTCTRSGHHVSTSGRAGRASTLLSGSGRPSSRVSQGCLIEGAESKWKRMWLVAKTSVSTTTVASAHPYWSRLDIQNILCSRAQARNRLGTDIFALIELLRLVAPGEG